MPPSECRRFHSFWSWRTIWIWHNAFLPLGILSCLILCQTCCIVMSTNSFLIASIHFMHCLSSGRFQASWNDLCSTNSMYTLNEIKLDSAIGNNSFPLFASATIFDASGVKAASRFFIALRTFGLIYVSDLGCTLTSFSSASLSYPWRSKWIDNLSNSLSSASSSSYT